MRTSTCPSGSPRGMRGDGRRTAGGPATTAAGARRARGRARRRGRRALGRPGAARPEAGDRRAGGRGLRCGHGTSWGGGGSPSWIGPARETLDSAPGEARLARAPSAARITSTGGGRRSTARRPPRPGAAASPGRPPAAPRAAAAAASQGVPPGPVDDVGHHLRRGRARPAGSSGGTSSPCSPRLVQLTTSAHWPAIMSSAAGAKGTGSPSSAALAGVRLATRTRAPRERSAKATARAAPPAPMTSASRPVQVERRLLVERPQEAGGVGVVGAEAALAVGHERVGRPDRRHRVGRRPSTAAITACLWGIVTLRPAHPAAARPAHRLRARASGCTGNAA